MCNFPAVEGVCDTPLHIFVYFMGNMVAVGMVTARARAYIYIHIANDWWGMTRMFLWKSRGGLVFML